MSGLGHGAFTREPVTAVLPEERIEAGRIPSAPRDPVLVPRTSLFASMRKLMAGNGFAQGLQFGAVLILSRLYLPADFGTLARVQTIGSVLAIVVSLQLHLSIPLSRTDGEVSTRVSAVETLAAVWVALAAALVVFGWKIEGMAAALAVILAGANTYSSVLVYRGRFGALSIFYVARAVLAITMQVAFGFAHVGGGLVAGAIAGELLSAILLRRDAVGLSQKPDVRPRAAIATIREQVAFTLYGTVQELVSVASFYAPVLLYASVYGAATGGQYAMANRLVFAPVVLLSGSAAQVLYHRLGQSPPTDLRSFRALLPSWWLVAALSALCVVPFFLGQVFLLVIGSGWQLASELIPLQVLWGAVFLLSTPARVVCRVRLLQRQQLLIDAATLCAIALAFSVSPAPALATMWRLVAIAVVQNVLLTGVVVSNLRPASAGAV